MTIWTQTRFGKAFDLVNPDPALIDFGEIALTLAELPRYAANFEKPITVAMHTLIAMAAADPDDLPYVLIHDAHEAFMGDITAPTAQALGAIAGAAHGQSASLAVKFAIDDLKARLDAAVHHAAGLALPSAVRRERIRRADLIALQTERRDFLAHTPKPWAASIEAFGPLRKKYRMRPPAIVAEELHARFNTYLPALRRRPSKDGLHTTPYSMA